MERLRSWKKWSLIFIDIVFINISYLAAFYFRFTYDVPVEHIQSYKSNAIEITLIYLLVFYLFKLYDSLWKYASIDEFMLAVTGCIFANIISIIYVNLTGPRLPYSISILAGIFSIITTVGFRMSFRIHRRATIMLSRADKTAFKRVLVVGAGSAGRMMIREMQLHSEMKYFPVAVVDDSRHKFGTSVLGVKVIGNRHKIEEIVVDKRIDVILIAIPSIDTLNKTKIINICKKTGCELKIIPGMYELLGSRVTLNKIRDVQVEDLLGREPIKLDMDGISDYIENKRILVTGGGGSIGSELCRQIARFNPKELAILDIYENNAYDIQNELRYKYPNLSLRAIIASVRDKKRIEKIFEEYKPEVVFHAAAHKHVPLMEDNPEEAIKNNIFGTLNVAEAADKYSVKRFVMISTDKAVNPTNVMGATKRACEMIIQSMDKVSKTEFVAVRFGNVLGSNGSVIPLFKKQITNGGPVTLTHKEITRYFMTIPEASQLVLQAGAFAKGGEIFVLDMGKPVKIYDLACDLIRLSGFEPGKDIEIKVTGLRPGEKLYEELLMAEEGLGKTQHKKIFVGSPTFRDIAELKRKFDELNFVSMGNDKEQIVKKLQEIVPTFIREGANEEVACSKEDKAIISSPVAQTSLPCHSER